MIRVLTFFVALVCATSIVSAQITTDEYASRRANLAEKIKEGVVVIAGAEEPEADYISFFQSTNFYYLTGFKEPDAALVMVVRNRGKQVDNILFVRPKDPAREVWSGYIAGPARASEITRIPARANTDLGKVLDSLKSIYKFHDNPAKEIRELRSRKSSAELSLLRKAVDITVQAHQNTIRSIKPGMNEYQAQALIEYTFRNNGADRPGFATIVGSGPNSTILHYNTNDRVMQSGDVVVMDIGASYQGYTADVTRTVPVNGRFTAEQRAVYQIVRDAQESAARAAQIGAEANDMVDSAVVTISAGLTRLGLIESSKATYDCDASGKNQCPQYRLFYMHGLGHSFGLQVHDPGTSPVQNGKLVPGDVFTIEPGIYVRENLLDIIPSTPRNEQLKSKISAAVSRYKNIGVRIEDDYIMTDRGLEWISRAPREIHEIEQLMGMSRE